MGSERFRHRLAENGVEKTPAQADTIYKAARAMFDALDVGGLDAIRNEPDAELRGILLHAYELKFGSQGST